ncbi:MAG TPA: hypothetical protein VI197_29035 [Polyangiaceae bacterium]
MTRSNKKAGPSPRKQPVWRRSRKSAHRGTGASTLLRKPTLRSTPPPRLETSPSDAPLDERPTPVPSAPRSLSAFEPPPDERPTPVMPEARSNSLVTERPVAFPLATELETPLDPHAKASSRTTPEKEKGSNSWLLAAAALALVAVGWTAIDNSGSKSSNSDASSGNVDKSALGAAPPAPVPPLEAAPPPAAPNEAAAPEEGVIDLDAPEVAKLAAAPQAIAAPRAAEPPKTVVPRASSARPAAKVEAGRAQEPAGAFDPSAAQAALATAAGQASSCRQDGDPTGVARVVVTFAPSGRVTSATISGPPFAGTQTGSCIARTMRGMSLPAFTGDHMTISKTVVIM